MAYLATLGMASLKVTQFRISIDPAADSLVNIAASPAIGLATGLHTRSRLVGWSTGKTLANIPARMVSRKLYRFFWMSMSYTEDSTASVVLR